ncbi:hypothetical protein E2C01_098134 [Portunus trituberculatus]|uniref:Secreted protein n=1 Tax=Portunus trituberculatus TaxID=210409 RepID=A0A5B7KD89_PORTR|nr:hypothetical protein [Portunus trituberculatus]
MGGSLTCGLALLSFSNIARTARVVSFDSTAAFSRSAVSGWAVLMTTAGYDLVSRVRGVG